VESPPRWPSGDTSRERVGHKLRGREGWTTFACPGEGGPSWAYDRQKEYEPPRSVSPRQVRGGGAALALPEYPS
jgi:hypothetical protein